MLFAVLLISSPLQRKFVPNLIQYFLDLLKSIHPGSVEKEAVIYCERFLEFMTDMLCQLPTRRFFHAYLEDRKVHIECALSKLHQMEQGQMFRDLLGIMQFYMSFEINDFSGAALDNNQIKQIQTRSQCARVLQSVQRADAASGQALGLRARPACCTRCCARPQCSEPLLWTSHTKKCPGAQG